MSALSFKTVACLALAALLYLPATAFASCENVAGEHHGRFDADKRSDVPDSGRPDNISGRWTATIDAATCEMTGEVESDMTGKVALKGLYDNAEGGKFRVTNVSLDVADTASYDTFSFGTDKARRMLHYVLIETAEYQYIGSFDGK